MPDITAQWRCYWALLDCQASDRVLDIGSDRGDAARLLLEICPDLKQVVALDRSLTRIKDAQALSHSRGSPPALALLAGDAMTLPFAGASFQRMICADTLEWLASPVQAIREMRRVLAPAGQLLLVHTDFDTQAFAGVDQVLTRRIVHAFTDAGPAGTIGRQLPRLAREGGFESVSTEIYPLVNEEYVPQRYSFRMVQLMCNWLLQTQSFSREELDGWKASIGAAAQRGEFWYSINRVLCLCRTSLSPA